jgi:hypothetical protein
MSDRFYVATRKGLFTLERSGPRVWAVSATAFVGDPVTMLLDDERDGTLYAALNLGHFGVKLHRSTNRGKDWEEILAPAHPPEPEKKADDAPAAPSVKQVWSLAGGGADRPGVLWSGTIPGGLFHSRNRGESWELVQSLWDRPERANWFGGGYDDPGIHSICVDPRDSRHVTVGVSCGGVWVTADAGESWDCRATGMFAEYMPEEKRDEPSIQDPHRVVQCVSAPDTMWAQHHNGVFRTTNAAELWEEVPDVPPSTFGFAVAVHPQKPEVAWLVPGVKDECRVPVDGKLVVTRTEDGGRTFEVLRRGLPQEHAYDIVYRHGLDVDATGRRLVLGSTTGGLWVSENAGDEWSCLSTHLPPIYQVLFAA